MPTHDTDHPLVESIIADYAVVAQSHPAVAYRLLGALEETFSNSSAHFVQLVAVREKDDDGIEFGDPYLVLPGAGTSPDDAVTVLEVDASTRWTEAEIGDGEVSFSYGSSDHEHVMYAVDQGRAGLLPVTLPDDWDVTT